MVGVIDRALDISHGPMDSMHSFDGIRQGQAMGLK